LSPHRPLAVKEVRESSDRCGHRPLAKDVMPRDDRNAEGNALIDSAIAESRCKAFTSF